MAHTVFPHLNCSHGKGSKRHEENESHSEAGGDGAKCINTHCFRDSNGKAIPYSQTTNEGLWRDVQKEEEMESQIKQK